MAKLTDEQERYLVAAYAAAEGDDIRVDHIENNIAERAGVPANREREVQVALEDAGFITSEGRLRANVTTRIFNTTTTAGRAYCEDRGGT